MAYEILDTVREVYEKLWSQGDVSLIDASFGEGYVGTIPLVGKLDRQGLKGAVQLFRKAFPDLRFEIKDILRVGDKVAVRWIGSGTHRGEFMGRAPTGKSAPIEGMTLLEFRDGKVVRDITHYDVLTLSEVIGMGLPGVAEAKPEKQPELRH